MSIFKPHTLERNNLSEAKGLLWYPHAEIIECGMRTQGSYTKKYPQGAVVHWTSGWSREGEKGNSANQFAINALKYGAKQGYAYFTISDSGQVYQAAPLDKWGHHAGASSWPGLGTGLSSKLVGIEVCCAGTVKPQGHKYVSWFGAEFSESEVRHVAKKDNVQAGYYHKYTDAQERSLIDLLLWLHKNNPEIFKLDYVLGHDSVSPGRKSDPGGSLSMTIPELVAKLKSLV